MKVEMKYSYLMFQKDLNDITSDSFGSVVRS